MYLLQEFTNIILNLLAKWVGDSPVIQISD